MKSLFAIESLEPRMLLAGVILEINGRLGPINTFMPVMASSIAGHFGGLSNISEYILTVDATGPNGSLAASVAHVSGTGTPQTTTSGEIVVLIDYYNVSANASYSAYYIGQVIADFMMNTPVDGVRWASLPVQEIGLSRGPAIMDGVSKELGVAGVWVDQETYLDPDPIAAQGDPASTVFSNVAFADDYWRNDGGPDSNGEGHPVNGAYNLNIQWVDTDDAGWGVSAHLVPSGYYIGTIDQNATQSGWGPIYSSWYGTTAAMPARNATGFLYTNVMGGTRPLSGVWTASGGTGARTDAGQSGSQWGDITDLTITSGTTSATNSSINVSYLEQDRDSGDTVTFYLDTDRNPFDSFNSTLGTVSLAQSTAITTQTQTLNLGTVTPGAYWICAQITDPAGHTRYAYESVTAPLTVLATPNPVANLASPPVVASANTQPELLTVTYTGTAPIDPTSFGSANLQVTGAALNEMAMYVGVDSNTGSETRVVTYSVPAPIGGWTTADDGSYTVSLQANQVRDTSNRYAAATTIGTFIVSIYNGLLSGSQGAAAASYNLTTLGTSDWAHWGTGNVASAFDHKATGNSQISNVTELGSGGNYGSWSDTSRDVTWTDGTPLASDAGDDSYIWANNAIGAGYSFTVPASTSPQTLYVYAGGYSSGATLTAHLSDAAAANDYVASVSGSSTYADLFAITFQAASAGRTLTISYVKSSNISGAGGSADLMAAALVGTPASDTTSPTAAVTSAPPITSASSSPYTFTVTYTDNVSVNASTLGNNNLLVTGSGYSQAATLVSTGLTNGPTIVATYSVPAPSGGWSSSSNGTYTIALQANQVADTSGNFAAPVASLGSFSVNIATNSGGGSLAGLQTTAASSYNLTTLGTSDWAHWGTGNVANAFDHKATNNSQISNVTRLGSGAGYGSYFSASRNVTWTDGTPLASDAGDDNYIWANNAIGAGYSFTVPASTSPQTLYVYAGGYSSGATLTAHLSDGSAADYDVTASGSGTYSNLYTITFNAASAGQSLTISYTKTTNINGAGGSVDLIAAALVGAPVPDTTAPTGSLTGAPSITAASSAAYNFTVTYSDNVAVNASTLGNNNLLVTGSGYSQGAMLVSTGLTNGPTIVATYSVPAPSGGWSTSSDGTYTVALQSNQVADTSGNFAAASNIGTFAVNISAPGAGSLSASQAAAASSYNLSTLGTGDWAHWGTGNVASAFDHKSTGGSQISNVTKLGTGAGYGSYFAASRNVTWTDGTPLASDSGDDNYIWANNAIGAGYSFTVPAGTTSRTLYVYAGGYSSGATLTAHLSDGSAADYVVTASGSGTYSNLYTITFKAASAGQILTISYVKSTNINGAGGSVDLIAAALA